MKIVPTSFIFLGKEVDCLSVACSDGLHAECLVATRYAEERYPEFREFGSRCDCRCHEMSACGICDTGEMQLVELAAHCFERHSDISVSEFGENGLTILRIGLNAAPKLFDIQRSLVANRLNNIYRRQILDWFRFGPSPSDELPPMACKLCSWEYYGCKGRQPTADSLLEGHLIERHGWKRCVPTHGTNLSVAPYYLALPFEIFTHRDPVDPPEFLELALAVVRMHQSLGYEEWEVFQPGDMLPFLPDGWTIMGALKSLSDAGWVTYLRDVDYRVEPSLPLACLRSGLGKSRQLKK